MKFIKSMNGSVTSGFVEKIEKEFGLSKIMSKIISSKGFSTVEEVELFLHPKKTQFENPFNLRGMAELVERIKKAKVNNEKILIFGDYDVDGIGATAIMLGALKKIGLEAKSVLPSRYVDGYGLTNDLVRKIKEEINPDLIITVDCGISCHDEVSLAQELGMEVIVTDHHEIPEILPSCTIVSAKQKYQEFSFNDLCGAGVAYKIAQALVGFVEAEEFLPLAAISTIADMVSLTKENRAIVFYGLQLFNTHLPIGLKQFLKFCKIDLKKILSTDISFRIAPKLNSPGRMGFAEDSLALYLERDPSKIAQIIEKINKYNDERVALCNRIHAECKEMIEKLDLQKNLCVVLSSKTWEQGVLGIICSRLVEELSRPVILFSEINGELKGSGRSVEGINIHEMLSSFDSCIEKFGGHAMAAGLTIKADALARFTEQANNYVANKSRDIVFSKIETYDEKIAVSDLTSKLANELDLLEPTGMGNSLPIFLVETNNVDLLPLKNFPEHLNVSIGKNFVGIFFGGSKCAQELSISGMKSFLVEIQRPKYKTKQIRGQIVAYGISNVSKQNFTSVSQQSLMTQLEHFDESAVLPNSVIQYADEDAISIISKKMENPFGTIVVSNSFESLQQLKTAFDLDTIRHSFFNLSTKSLLNSVLIAPISFDWFDKMSNIIFLDGVSSNGYISALSNVTNANIYLPKSKKIDASIFYNLKTNRIFMGNLFNAFKKQESHKFDSLNEMFQLVSPTVMCSFENAYLGYLIFKEIKVFDEYYEGGKYWIVQSEQKGSLEQSKIAAYVRAKSIPQNGEKQ